MLILIITLYSYFVKINVFKKFDWMSFFCHLYLASIKR